MRVGLLGALQVEDDGRPVDVGGARLRALLARLALDAGRAVSAAALVDAVWEDELPADEHHALQSLVSRLRRGLGDAKLILQAPSGYTLAIEPADVDALRFERAAAEGSVALARGDAERAASTLRDALALWRGPALADLTSTQRFARAAAARLEDARLTATLARIEADFVLGAEGLAAELDRLATSHPLDERVARHQIRALAAAGRQADALAAYERIRRALDTELGALPGPELQAAHVAVLRGETQERPVARAPARSRTNLRTPLTSFVGRDAEVTDLTSALADHRLVTLLGPGGAGKTRLAQEAAARCVDHVPDGVWLVELAPVREAAEVAPVTLAAIGLREAGVTDPVAGPPLPTADALRRLVDLLADRRAILVLDNCEHLVDAAARVTEELLGRCPHVRVVATSREPLGIGGERIFEIPPLAWPPAGANPEEALRHPAVELLRDRAVAASPGFVLDASNVEPIVEICRRLDGQPLAIELAAARLRSLPPHELARRLDDRFRLLTGGSRTALPRHRTLRAVVDWSWELLPGRERALARRLSVLAAGATPESAEAVCAGSDLPREDVLETLSALVDRSLVQVVDPAVPRYRMLETIREYGLEKLEEAGETNAVHAAHARHFAELAFASEPLLRTADQLPPLRLLTAERENVVAALRHLVDTGDARAALHLALSLVWFMLLSGDGGEAIPLLRLARAAEGEPDPDERAFADVVLALADARDEDDDRAIDPADLDPAVLRGMADGLADVDVEKVPLAPFLRAMLVWIGDDKDAGAALLDEVRDHPDPWVRAMVPLARAQIAENEGDIETLRAALAEALPQLRAVGDRWALAFALITDAHVRMLGGDLDAAATALDEAHAVTDALGTRGWTAVLELRLAELRLRRGDIAEARASLERMPATHDLAPEEQLFVLAMRARVAWLAGADEEARALRRDLQRLVADLPLSQPERAHGLVVGYASIGALLIEEGELDEAEAMLTSAYPDALRTRDMPIVALVGVAAATLAQRRGRPLDAAEMLGASARVRGSEDESNREIAELAARLRATLGDEPYTAAYARGLDAPRDAAIARLHPASEPLSHAARVGP